MTSGTITIARPKATHQRRAVVLIVDHRRRGRGIGMEGGYPLVLGIRRPDRGRRPPAGTTARS
jgi:hypothetical protein